MTASSTVATTIKGADSTSDALQAVPNALGKAASTSQVSTDINHLEGVDFTLLLMDEDEPGQFCSRLPLLLSPSPF